MDQVVADKTIAARSKPIQLFQCGGQTGGAQGFFAKRQWVAGLLIDGGQRIDSPAAFSNFQIDRDTAHREPGVAGGVPSRTQATLKRRRNQPCAASLPPGQRRTRSVSRPNRSISLPTVWLTTSSTLAGLA